MEIFDVTRSDHEARRDREREREGEKLRSVPPDAYYLVQEDFEDVRDGFRG